MIENPQDRFGLHAELSQEDAVKAAKALRKINRRDPLWKAARKALKNEAAEVHVTIDETLLDRLARAVVDELRDNVTVAENMWREVAEDRKRHADEAWKLVRKASPFVNAVLCMTIDRFRAEGKSAPALEWLGEAAVTQDERRKGERMAEEIQMRLGRHPNPPYGRLLTPDGDS
jgi:hypothetical protein